MLHDGYYAFSYLSVLLGLICLNLQQVQAGGIEHGSLRCLHKSDEIGRIVGHRSDAKMQGRLISAELRRDTGQLSIDAIDKGRRLVPIDSGEQQSESTSAEVSQHIDLSLDFVESASQYDTIGLRHATISGGIQFYAKQH
jgi:hypothetical protein